MPAWRATAFCGAGREKAQAANFSRETVIPYPKQLIGHETVETTQIHMHGIQKPGLGGEAERHAGLDSADVARMRSAFAPPSEDDPKRRRRCALPAHSKASHVPELQRLQQCRS